MTTPSPLKVFESALRPDEPSSLPYPTSHLNHLNRLVREKLDAAEAKSMDVGSDRFLSAKVSLQGSEPITLFQNLGDYMVRTAALWSELTHSLTNGQHIDDAKRAVHDEVMRDTGCSNMAPIIAMDTEFKKLSKIQELSVKYARDVEAIWKPQLPPCPPPPNRPSRPLSLSQLLIPEEMTLRAPPQAPQPPPPPPVRSNRNSVSSAVVKVDQTSPSNFAEDDDSSDDSDLDLFDDIDMNALSTRGKGGHLCPKGERCDKGGVDKHGKVVVFDRNSSFAQHINKHTKPFLCKEPGCPNPPKKRRFARRDGLMRHQHHVEHVVGKPPRSD